MQFLLANLTGGTLLPTPTLTVGTLGVGTHTNYFYGVSAGLYSKNVTPAMIGEGTINPLQYGTLGTGLMLTWTMDSAVTWYTVYKGTANGTFGTYMWSIGSISGTLGTYIDGTNFTPSAVATGTTPMSYTNAIFLPTPAAYSITYTNNFVTQEMANKDMLIYDKSSKPVIPLSFIQISENQESDMQTIYNWRSPMRFFPNADGNPGKYYDVFWSTNYSFTWTIPTYTNGGYDGNIQLNALYGNNAAGKRT